MFKNSQKIEYLNKLQIKRTQYVKQQALPYGYFGFSKYWVFDPKFSKTFFSIHNKTLYFSKFETNGIYDVEAGPEYAHAKFLGNPVIFDR